MSFTEERFIRTKNARRAIQFGLVLVMVFAWGSVLGAKPAEAPLSEETVGVSEPVIDASVASTPVEEKLAVETVVIPEEMKVATKKTPITGSEAVISDEVKAQIAAEKAAAAAAKSAATASTAAASTGSGEWSSAVASCYGIGDGLIGEGTASGKTLTADCMYVAHKTLPFGTHVEFSYNGHTVVGVVEDRGPFHGNRTFDLGPGVANALGFDGVHTVSYRIL